MALPAASWHAVLRHSLHRSGLMQTQQGGISTVPATGQALANDQTLSKKKAALLRIRRAPARLAQQLLGMGK